MTANDIRLTVAAKKMETEVSINLTRSLIQFATARGAAIKLLCQAAGINEDALAQPDARIPGHRSAAVWRKAEELTGDADIGLHLGEAAHPSILGIVGFVMMSSETFGEALEKLVRYTNLLTDGVRGALEREDQTACLRVEITSEQTNALLDDSRQRMETTFSSVVTIARVLTGAPLLVLKVEFQHQRPARTGEHERIFAAPVLFGQPENQLVFRANALTQPVLLANRDLLPAFETQAAEMLRQSEQTDDLAARTEREIRKKLIGEVPTINDIARALGVGERTLQRELACQNTSFRALLDQVRRDLAMWHLRRRAESIAEIAFLLGFSEPSAFHRSFKRWTGQTPDAFRASL